MDIGFIGLGNMGLPMARRLIEAGNRLVVFDTRREVVDKLVARGATAATSPKEVADQVETVMASLPSLQASLAVARRRTKNDHGPSGSPRPRRTERSPWSGSRAAHCGVNWISPITCCPLTRSAFRKARSTAWSGLKLAGPRGSMADQENSTRSEPARESHSAAGSRQPSETPRRGSKSGAA